MKKIFFAFAMFSIFQIQAQKLVSILDENLTVNSTSAMSGYTRNKAEIQIPEKTKGYIYRITVLPKGSTNVSNTLFDILQNSGDPRLLLASSLAKFAIHNNDGNSIDAFIFNNIYDAENFYNKNDFNWNACKSLPNRSNCCFSSTDCLGQRIYFGFRNNNIMQGLDVRLEVVAVVDESLSSAYFNTYSISNSTNYELNYFISYDNLNWEEVRVRNGYVQTHKSDKDLYVKITSLNNKTVNYKLTANERYKLFYNNGGFWDLARY